MELPLFRVLLRLWQRLTTSKTLLRLVAWAEFALDYRIGIGSYAEKLNDFLFRKFRSSHPNRM